MFSYSEISELTFINATLNSVNDSFCWGAGIRNDYVLHYVKKGSGYFECGGKKYFLTKGQCFLIFPNTLIKYYVDENDPWEYAWIEFKGEHCEKLLRQTSIKIENPVTDIIDGKILDLIEELSLLNNCFDIASQCRATGLLYMCFSCFLKLFPNKSEIENRDYVIKEAVYLLQNNYRKPQLNIAAVADELHINRSSLYRHFVKQIGISPNKYLLKLRIEKARQLLQSTECSVKDIAYSVGFSDNLYFSKVFKNETGLNPSKFRLK